MLQIGNYQLTNKLLVAPMAGVTDQPFRKLCRSFGAGYSVSEMVTSKPELWHSLKTSRRLNHDGEPSPIAVQIAGTDAAMLASAAKYNIAKGAQIIDVNMGCPAKKVCNKLAGAALMRDEKLVAEILTAVVNTASYYQVPVTLKIRTGWDNQAKNALNIAKLAEAVGIQLLVIHGRTREQRYSGQAEYDTIAQIKAEVKIPVVANGDIDSPQKAAYVLDYTKADGLMIGRAAQGKPWIFREINYFLQHGKTMPPIQVAELSKLILQHIQQHYQLYGLVSGARSVRKHITWYAKHLPQGNALRLAINQQDDAKQQENIIKQYFSELLAKYEFLPAV